MRPRSRRSPIRALLGAVVACVLLQTGIMMPAGGREAAAAEPACISPDVLRAAERAQHPDVSGKPAPAAPLVLLRQICVNGEPAPSSSPVYLDRPDEPPHPNQAATVTTNEAFASGVLLRAPASAAFDLVSERTVTHLFPGAEIEKYAKSESDFNHVLSGKVGFWVTSAAGAVSQALRAAGGAIGSPTVGVIAENVYCVSRDTVFSVDVLPKKSVTVAVTEGTVDLTRATSIRLVAEGAVLDGIRDSEVLNAGQTATYAVSPAPREFSNAGEARTYFVAQLQAALERNDRPRIEDWAFNLRRLEESAPTAAQLPPQKAGRPTLLTAAAGVLLLAVPILLGSGGGKVNLQRTEPVLQSVPRSITGQGKRTQLPLKQ